MRSVGVGQHAKVCRRALVEQVERTGDEIVTATQGRRRLAARRGQLRGEDDETVGFGVGATQGSGLPERAPDVVELS